MPPKKLTKGEKDRLKQEAERKAAEEEEQRLKEEEERKRIEEEKRQREEEEKAKLQAEEQTRFEEEKVKYVLVEERLEEHVQKWLKYNKENKEWNHYTSCNRHPYPTDERALNTYISVFKEKQIGKATQLKHVFERIQDLLILEDELECALHDGGPNSLTYYCSQVHALIETELNKGTLFAMENSSQYIDSETFNLILEDKIGSPSLIYCLWGNVLKNPRLKEFSFKYQKFTLELPKSMLLADVAVRLIHLPYDHLSPTCKTYFCPIESIKNTEEETAMEGGVANEEGEEHIEPELESIHSTSKNTSRVGSSKSTKSEAKSEVKSEAKSEVKSEVKPETPATNSEKTDGTAVKDEGEGEKVEGEEGEKEEEKKEEISEGLIPLNEDEIDMRGYTVVTGSPVLMDLLVLPPQPKSANNWMIRQSTMDTVMNAPDLVDLSGTPSLIAIDMDLPESYYYPDEVDGLQLGQWDKDTCSWRTASLKEAKFDLVARKVTFITNKFSPIAILVDSYINLPYQSWELLPLGPNHTLLHIVGSIVEMAIEIKVTQCKLIKPADTLPVQELQGHIFNSVPALIKALKKIGLHFFPAKDAHKYTSLTTKDEQLEESVYKYMSMTCGGWGFQWSQWNEKGGVNSVVLQAISCSNKEWSTLSTDTSPDNLEGWTNYMSSNEKSVQLKVTEIDEEFTDTPFDGQQTHSELYTTLLTNSTPKISELVSQTDPMHIQTVHKLLTATRPIVATC